MLERLLIKDSQNTQAPEVRTAYGVMCSIVGMICNVCLFLGKLLVGISINSISVMADAFNNLSDCAASLVSLVGIKLAGRPADKEHPFGHGRYEYIAALAVAFLVLQVAFSCIKSSIDKIRHPEELGFGILPLIILVVSVLVKLCLSFFYRKNGKKIESGVLKASATDSLGDALITGVTACSLVLGYLFEINIDGYMGCAVSVFILLAGVNIARDTIEPLLGKAVDHTVYKKITEKVTSYAGIEGTHDLIVHNYGPTHSMATIHAEVRNDIGIEAAHEIIDKIERDVMREMGILLVIHMDPIEVNDIRVTETAHIMKELVKKLEPSASLHDFRMVSGEQQINLIFDLVLPYGYIKAKEQELLLNIMSGARATDSRYQCVITVENSFVEEE